VLGSFEQGTSMIEAKEIDGELWIKATDHHKEVKVAIERERRECAKVCAEVGSWTLVHEIEARGQV
jgi:hypothetical protein